MREFFAWGASSSKVPARITELLPDPVNGLYSLRPEGDDGIARAPWGSRGRSAKCRVQSSGQRIIQRREQVPGHLHRDRDRVGPAALHDRSRMGSLAIRSATHVWRRSWNRKDAGKPARSAAGRKTARRTGCGVTAALRATEDERVRAFPPRLDEPICEGARQPHRRRSSRLRRDELDTAVNLGRALNHVDRAAERAEPADPERRDLAPTQARVCHEGDQQRVVSMKSRTGG
jgi:hypothetical protein